MKTKIEILCLIFFTQLIFAQNENRKPLHGQFKNDSTLVDKGYVFNLNSKTRTFISDKGFFDILVKANDTLLVLSPAFKSKKIIIENKDFSKTLFTVNLESQTTLLKEVFIKGKTEIRPAMGNSQVYTDMQFTDDIKSSPKNKTMPADASIENGMDFVRMFKMVSKVFQKDTTTKADLTTTVAFSDQVYAGVNSYFFTNTLQLKTSEIQLFLDYCEKDPRAKTLLKQQDEFRLIDFLITKNEEFKKDSTSKK